MRSAVIFFLVIVLLGGAYCFYFYNPEIKLGYAYIGAKRYSVEVADTQAKRTSGLQNRDKIGVADGMVFIFERPGLYSFWMKDVKFPLDFVWINDGKIIAITESVPIATGGNYPSYTPPGTVTHVIEFAAGRILRENIKVGDSVSFDI